MKNYVQEGKVISFVAPSGGVVSGQGLLLGDIFGVVEFTAAQDQASELAVCGVFSLPKAAVAINNGDKVYWDDSAKNVTDVATAHKYIGIATETVLSGDTTVNVRLCVTLDSNLDVATVADVVTALEALTGADRLSADAVKDGSNYGTIALTDRAKVVASNAAKTNANAHTVTAGEATAGQVDIDTGFAAAPTAFLYDVYRAGVKVTADAAKSNLGGGDVGKVRIADGSATYVTTENDVIEYIAIKV